MYTYMFVFQIYVDYNALFSYSVTIYQDFYEKSEKDIKIKKMNFMLNVVKHFKK